MTTSYATVLNGPCLYNRQYSVALQAKGAKVGVQWGNETGNGAALRCNFEVERQSAGGNKAKITLYNLSDVSRAQFGVGTAVRLRAGYVGLVGTLFLGYVAKVEHKREGPDISSQFELRDAEPYVNVNVFNKPYAKGVHLTTILQDAADAMQVNFYNEVVTASRGIALGIPDHIYSQGFVAHGPVKNTLDKLCRPRGLEWSVQNGALNVVPKNQGNGRTAEIVSAGTGLVGIPSKSDKLVVFDCLMNAKIVPSSVVQLVTSEQNLSGFYKVRSVKYEGDTHDAAWTAHVEAIPIGGKVNVLPVARGQSYIGGVLP